MSLFNEVMEGFNYGSSDGYRAASEGAALDFCITDKAILEMTEVLVNTKRVVNAADIMGSMKYLMEGTDVSPTMEGFFDSAITKIKNGFIKLKNTIKAWFAKAVKFFQSLFKQGKDFTDAYGAELRKKNTDGFTYRGYEWDKEKGDALVDGKICSRVDKLITGMIGDLADAANKHSGDLSFTKTDDGNSGYGDNVIAELSIGASNLSDMKSEIVKAYHGGASDTTTEAVLTSARVNEYLSFVETGKGTIASIKKAEGDFESKLNSIISTLDNISNKKDDDNPDRAKNASAVSSCLKDLLAIKKGAVDSKIACYRDMVKAETAVLKKFLHWGGKKEAVTNSTYYDMSELEALEATYPILESDMIMEEGLECASTDDDVRESYYDFGGSNSLFDQVGRLIGV